MFTPSTPIFYLALINFEMYHFYADSLKWICQNCLKTSSFSSENKVYLSKTEPQHISVWVLDSILMSSTYLYRWKSRGETFLWPLGSSDINPIKFLVRRLLKYLTYTTAIENVRELRSRESVHRRIDTCICIEGAHFQQLLLIHLVFFVQIVKKNMFNFLLKKLYIFCDKYKRQQFLTRSNFAFNCKFLISWKGTMEKPLNVEFSTSSWGNR